MAAAITNLAPEPRSLEIRSAAGYQPLTIAAGMTWRTPGKIFVRYRGHEMRIEDDEEYAIWPSGDFGPQKRITHSRGIVP